MSWTPANIEAYAYKGDDFGYVFEFIENGSPLDLTTVNDITVTLYTKGEDLVTHTGSDLTISGTDNEILSGVLTSSDTDIDAREYLFKIVFELPSTRTYVLGTLEIFDDPEEGSTVSSFKIEIDDVTKTANSSQLTDLTAIALQAKEDAETAESGAVSAKDAAEAAESNAETSATNAANSESNAAASEAESQDNADDAEKQAQNTTSFTDSDGNSFDKGAKGYAQDAEGSANTAETTSEQKVIEAHGYYSKELSNIKERLRTLENA